MAQLALFPPPRKRLTTVAKCGTSHAKGGCYVGRGSPFGNYSATLQAYERNLRKRMADDAVYAASVGELRGRALYCHCVEAKTRDAVKRARSRCHAAVLACLLNGDRARVGRRALLRRDKLRLIHLHRVPLEAHAG